MIMEGRPFIVTTSGVAEEQKRNPQFTTDMAKSLGRFFRKDWGAVDEEDWESNDRDFAELNKGNYGRIIASYTTQVPHKYGHRRFWIIRDTETITVLFPEEY